MSVTLSNSVTNIGVHAFYACSQLDLIIVKGKTQEQANALLSRASVPSGCSITVSGSINPILGSFNTLRSVQVISNSTMPVTADIVAVLFDPSTKKIETTEILKDVELSRDGSAQTINFNGKITYSHGKIIKVFVWDRVGDFKPLMNSYQYSGE